MDSPQVIANGTVNDPPCSVERRMGDTELSYYLPARENGVNDMWVPFPCGRLLLICRIQVSPSWVQCPSIPCATPPRAIDMGYIPCSTPPLEEHREHA